MQMTLVPLTIVLRNLGAHRQSLFGLFWIYLGFGLPFGILVLRGFMKHPAGTGGSRVHRRLLLVRGVLAHRDAAAETGGGFAAHL